MIAPLTNHLWQSTVFCLAVAITSFLLRPNRAHVRYALWFAASVKFLVPFSLLVALGALVPIRTAQPSSVPIAPGSFSSTVDQLTQPFSAMGPPTPATSPWHIPWTAVAFAIWFSMFAAVVIVRLRAWRSIRHAVQTGVPFRLNTGDAIDVRSSSTTVEPGVVGLWRPILLVPDHITERLTPRQLEAVVAHELCHVRRRDNLTAAVHMSVEALCWFHPLVWWIGARLVAERERACDEAVLEQGLEPRDYADAIVNVCKLCVESPLSCVAGVTGSNLRKRIDDIVISRIGVVLTRARKVGLILGSIAALAAPVAIGSITAPLHAQWTFAAAAPGGQVFEAASIRPCTTESIPPGGRSGGGSGSFSPGRVYLTCFIVKNLITTAYVNEAGSRDRSDAINNYPRLLTLVDPSAPQPIRGGPSWVYSEKYTIEAKADGLDPTVQTSADRHAMMGPMLRALLEERFRLKMHRASENAPMYALTVAKGGLKVKPIKDGDCTKDRSKGPITVSDARRRGVTPTCGTINGGPDGSNWRYDEGGQDFGPLANVLSNDLGIMVLDRTGITDKFNITWEYGPDENTPGIHRWRDALGLADPAAPPTAPDIFTALRDQIGLQLEKITGTRDYLVIDGIERPTIGGTSTQSAPAVPKFEALSVRSCAGDDTPPGRRGGGPGAGALSPGRLQLNCLPLVGTPGLIREAYAVHATGRLSAYWVDLPVENAPAWTKSERYTIEAKAEGTPSADMMRGPMLQAVLEDAFQLRAHREPRETPVYELTVAKSGSRLHPFDGSCTPVDFTKPGLPSQLEAPGACRIVMANTTVNAPGATIDDFIKFALVLLDRPVINKTGLDGRFDIYFELPAHEDPADLTTTIATELPKQLGLKLTPAKGNRDVLVIDHVERPRR
jgi:uncharacterized protein (TIGR03435 family)